MIAQSAKVWNASAHEHARNVQNIPRGMGSQPQVHRGQFISVDSIRKKRY